MKSNRISLYIIIGALSIASCSHVPRSVAAMQLIDKNGWDQQHAVVCKILVKDSLSLYHIDVTGRLRNTYPFDSLSTIVQVTAPSGRSFSDTVFFTTTHPRNRPYSDFRFSYCSNVCFSERGTWEFSFLHQMDVQILKGVMSIGIYMEKEKERYGEK